MKNRSMHSRTDSSQDAAVDQLNSQSYQAAQQGQTGIDQRRDRLADDRLGDGTGEAFGCDLTEEYVVENSEYTT